MTARFFLLVFLFGVPTNIGAQAMPSVTLSNQELSGEVTGTFVTLAVRDVAQGNRDMAMGMGGSRYANFLGIETRSMDSGSASVAQAATSLSIRASLALSAGMGLGFSPRN
jgi:hypothetical protein